MSLLSPPAQESLPRGLVWFSFFQHRVACEVLWVLGEVARVACEVSGNLASNLATPDELR